VIPAGAGRRRRGYPAAGAPGGWCRYCLPARRCVFASQCRIPAAFL